jgi:hypothetical protein
MDLATVRTVFQRVRNLAEKSPLEIAYEFGFYTADEGEALLEIEDRLTEAADSLYEALRDPARMAQALDVYEEAIWLEDGRPKPVQLLEFLRFPFDFSFEDYVYARFAGTKGRMVGYWEVACCADHRNGHAPITSPESLVLFRDAYLELLLKDNLTADELDGHLVDIERFERWCMRKLQLTVSPFTESCWAALERIERELRTRE